jgi:UDP-N-acetylmuramyl pentapeptide phosphotransferase/UDP-N-acetylglucosamine-1-phosphate transferase
MGVVRRRLVAEPNERSSHDFPTPTGGGIALVVGVIAGLVALGVGDTRVTAAAGMAVVLAALGLAEDIRELPIISRLVSQIVIVTASLYWLLSDWKGSTAWLLLFSIGSLVWIVGYTNAFNFMDGIDGIATAQLILAGLTWVAIGSIENLELVRGLGALTAATAVGFLPWNFPRARFFMGDVGAYFGGSWLAGIAIVAVREGAPLPVIVAPLLIFGVDTAFTLVKKREIGLAWHEPHKYHIYQRLVSAGWSHAQSTFFYSLVAGGVAAAGLLWLTSEPWLIAVGSAVALLLVYVYLTAPTRFIYGGLENPGGRRDETATADTGVGSTRRAS